jgi:arginine/lysine/ornithine decarboxylase
MARKTFNVNALVVTVNEMCRLSTCSQEVRQGAINVLEHVLYSTDNYRGFKYLLQDDVPVNEKPGMNWGFDNDYEARFFDTDPTRVYFFFA